eukprot:CAMPEP_0170527132 /NCGR_PEP_ID=MMETSP0209-20121228/12585_1 /TAXON_ID=665100 ORGANISM="Litonotus pictus, Strain P1" /NCGR_SAMPLE_ID=MMETSP0209 /ASSEMBLY_ACC=CAM_ASM_000301 /LENGTH=446 /DNA_ID=CAMNT_0010817437 /DNA_START=193 /DNA_END=1529 /DNA_ORIENTATION=+
MESIEEQERNNAQLENLLNIIKNGNYSNNDLNKMHEPGYDYIRDEPNPRSICLHVLQWVKDSNQANNCMVCSAQSKDFFRCNKCYDYFLCMNCVREYKLCPCNHEILINKADKSAKSKLVLCKICKSEEAFLNCNDCELRVCNKCLNPSKEKKETSSIEQKGSNNINEKKKESKKESIELSLLNAKCSNANIAKEEGLSKKEDNPIESNIEKEVNSESKKDGKMILGEKKYSNGSYKGQLLNGQRHGYGTFTFNPYCFPFVRYEGEWENDHIQGKGSFIAELQEDHEMKINYEKTFKGSWVEKKEDIYVLKNSSNPYKGILLNQAYYGQFNQDFQPDGSGKIWGYGYLKFEGKFKDGLSQGTGKKYNTCYYGHYLEYSGGYDKGKREGKGYYYLRSSDCGIDTTRLVYAGYWKDNLYNGWGKFYKWDRNYLQYFGQWKDGKYHGQG